MKIIYLHQYFRTPEQGGAVRSYYLAKALVEAGHQVEMISTHNQQQYRHQFIDGISVHYLPISYSNHLGFWRRMFAFVRFLYSAYKRAKSIENVHLCYATSTPLTVGLIALLLKKRNRIRYFFEVRDVWPQAAVELGFLKSKWLIGLAQYLEKKIYQNAEKIIALSPFMQAHIQAKVAQKEVFLLPNFADTDFFEPNFEQVQRSFTILYIGTLGLANHLEYLIELAYFIQEQGDTIVQFKIMGEGARETALRALATQLGLKNLTFLPQGNKTAVKQALAEAQAVYVSFKTLLILQSNSPNKFFDGLASAKLMLVNTQGWLKELVEKHTCGFYAHPKKPEEVYQQLQAFIHQPQLLLEYQKNARKLAEEKFSLRVNLPVFLELFNEETVS